MPFFPGVNSALDLTPEQLALLEFISIYESVDDLDPRDRPEQSTVENDAEFDRWIKEYVKRKEVEVISGDRPTASKHKNVIRFHGNDEDGGLEEF